MTVSHAHKTSTADDSDFTDCSDWFSGLRSALFGHHVGIQHATQHHPETQEKEMINSGNVFGVRSEFHLSQMHEDLQLILRESIKSCPVDFGVHESHRSFEKQLEYFLDGKSKIDPRTGRKSKHMIWPSHAADIHVSESHKGKSLTWDQVHLAAAASWIQATAVTLHKQGRVSHIIRWGGNWDSDGVIALDQSLVDMPHIELIKT